MSEPRRPTTRSLLVLGSYPSLGRESISTKLCKGCAQLAFVRQSLTTELILLDTNVLSEALRIEPDRRVINWLNRNHSQCAISSISILELGIGVVALPAGKRRTLLEAAISRMVQRFGPRVYAFDFLAATAAVELHGAARAGGHAFQRVADKMGDVQIAGIALAYGLMLATRNVRDFSTTGLTLIDPWRAAFDE